MRKKLDDSPDKEKRSRKDRPEPYKVAWEHKIYWLPVLVAALVALIVWQAIVFFDVTADDEQPATDGRPDVVQQVPDSDTSFYDAYAPWTDSVIVDGEQLPSDSDSIVWLDANGNVSSTDKVELVSGDWVDAELPPYATRLTASLENNLVQMRIANNTYTVYVGQWFLYEGNSDTIYRISADETAEKLINPVFTKGS